MQIIGKPGPEGQSRGWTLSPLPRLSSLVSPVTTVLYLIKVPTDSSVGPAFHPASYLASGFPGHNKTQKINGFWPEATAWLFLTPALCAKIRLPSSILMKIHINS